MRLLNTETLKIHDFSAGWKPQYAILSHRWEEDEVDFDDVLEGKNLEKAGWKKVKAVCKLVEKYYDWVWMDTCCIAKSSSAELSEAINSMHAWYSQANMCFVYLNDVLAESSDLDHWRDIQGHGYPEVTNQLDYAESTVIALKASKWFTRSWTLQELVAPKCIYFVDREWRMFGTQTCMHDLIRDITGIDRYAKWKPSIATKMSWASKREATREEDKAYSLLGLFGVHMPLLYGEGEHRAFRRLQLEIIKKSDDESIFAWQRPLSSDARLITRTESWHGGMLADSPRDFLHSSKIIPFPPTTPRPPFAMTNKGLEISTVLLRKKSSNGSHAFMPLNCHPDGDENPLAVQLYCYGPRQYARVNQTSLDGLSSLRWPETSEVEPDDYQDSKPVRIHIDDGGQVEGQKHQDRKDAKLLHALQSAIDMFCTPKVCGIKRKRSLKEEQQPYDDKIDIPCHKAEYNTRARGLVDFPMKMGPRTRAQVRAAAVLVVKAERV